MKPKIFKGGAVFDTRGSVSFNNELISEVAVCATSVTVSIALFSDMLNLFFVPLFFLFRCYYHNDE